MSYDTKERLYYNIRRAKTCEKLGITKNQYNWLRRKGEELHKVYEDNCNGEYDKRALILNDGVSADTCYEIDCSMIEGEIFTYLIKQKLNTKEHKLYVYFQTDPRGATIYLDTKEIPENNYNQAECIY